MNSQSELKTIEYHSMEAKRIQIELDNLSNVFAPDGIVRTILRSRIRDEKDKAKYLTSLEENL